MKIKIGEVIAIAAIGYGAYWFFIKNKSTTETPTEGGEDQPAGGGGGGMGGGGGLPPAPTPTGTATTPKAMLTPAEAAKLAGEATMAHNVKKDLNRVKEIQKILKENGYELRYNVTASQGRQVFNYYIYKPGGATHTTTTTSSSTTTSSTVPVSNAPTSPPMPPPGTPRLTQDGANQIAREIYMIKAGSPAFGTTQSQKTSAINSRMQRLSMNRYKYDSRGMAISLI